MIILVTGGAGYVGSHAARRLAAAGHDVWVFDNLSYGHRQAVAEGRLIEGDLHDGALLRQLLADKQIEAVMHFAALTQVGESVEDPARYYHNNVVGTSSLLEAMRQSDVRKFIFSSTTATYGVPDNLPITEQESQQPINPYGFTKLVVEHMLADYAAAYGLSYATLRYFNAAGAHPAGDLGESHDPETHLIPIVLQVALGMRESISIFGNDYPTPDGTCVRDYVHVDDLAAAHLLALEKLVPGEGLKLNLGSQHGNSVLEVIEACRQVTGATIPTVDAARRPGDPALLVADASLAASLLGWQPRYTEIGEIVETAWNWHRQHPHGFAE
jgi:UDP-glucose 4-epimerase